ncbi:MAG: hypothetical protein FJ077_05950 [Cyanobacteria bacterium K_DeepCast_35m_m2_023]|nr:hypothetical protein [Cyanobacteria bacterium K_DeepCast_35m_m2_023]
MVFNRKASFFLDLGSEGAKPAQVAVAAPAPAPQTDKTVKPGAPAAAVAPSRAEAPVLTTAEAIAAELRAAQEAKPAAALSTFAPDCLNPANAVPTRRRKPGANMGGFKAMASSLFKS